MEKIEYRVRPVTRFIVTRFHQSENGSGISQIGEYDNEEQAFQVGHGCATADHQRLGWAPGDERIIYPSPRIESAQIGGPLPDKFPLRS